MSIQGIALALLIAGHGLAAEAPTPAQLAALEDFAVQPSAQIRWTSPAQTIESAGAQAAVMAIIIDDAQQTPPRMRGIRIDLTTQESKEEVYIPEQFIGRLLKSLKEVSDNSPSFLTENQGGNVCFGSCEFLAAMRAGAHFFTASQCSSEDGSVLNVSTGRALFPFVGLDPGPFTAAIEQAQAALAEH